MIVYICSPYRGDIAKSKRYARVLTRECLLSGDTPITPHLYITEVLDNNYYLEEIIGTDCGFELLNVCSKLIVGKKYGISEGMKKVIQKAKEWGIKIEYKEG